MHSEFLRNEVEYKLLFWSFHGHIRLTFVCTLHVQFGSPDNRPASPWKGTQSQEKPRSQRSGRKRRWAGMSSCPQLQRKTPPTCGDPFAAGLCKTGKVVLDLEIPSHSRPTPVKKQKIKRLIAKWQAVPIVKNLRGIRRRKVFFWHKPWPNRKATFLLEIFTLIIAPKWGMADENIMLKGVYEETLTDPNFQLVLVSQNHERKSGPKFNYTNLVSYLWNKSNYHYFQTPTYQTHPSLYLPICVSAC